MNDVANSNQLFPLKRWKHDKVKVYGHNANPLFTGSDKKIPKLLSKETEKKRLELNAKKMQPKRSSATRGNNLTNALMKILKKISDPKTRH